MTANAEAPPSPDAVLIAAGTAARAAVAAYDAEAAKDDPGDALAVHFERERLALECVAATRARTPRGIAEKACLLDECAETTETAALVVSLAEDAVALVKGMVGASRYRLTARGPAGTSRPNGRRTTNAARHDAL